MEIIKKTKNIINYVEENLKTFSESDVNEVDALIFSWLSYYRLSEEVYKKDKFIPIKLKEIYTAKYFKEMTYDIFDSESSVKLLSRIASSPRFRDVDIFYYVQNTDKTIEKQFSAMTFKIDKNKYVVAFRGTDHTFVGWKEDFNMSYISHVPAQIDAKKYLNNVSKKLKGDYYVTGHSKGGNLAVYASAFSNDKVKSNIKTIFNFDGPSLNKTLINTDEYIGIIKKEKKYVPQSSVVGMCFEKTSKYHIIKSDAVGVFQHNPFSWEVVSKSLKTLKDSTFDSKMFKNGINALIDTLSEEELKLFTNTIYETVEATDTDTVEKFLENIKSTLPIVFNRIGKFDNKQKELLNKIGTIFIKESFRNIFVKN